MNTVGKGKLQENISILRESSAFYWEDHFMKTRLCHSLVLFLFAGTCFAQQPAPTLNEALNEVSADLLIPIKDQSHIGIGGQVTATHFFGDNVGLQLQGDYLTTDEYNLRDVGARIGPVVRFRSQQAIQPYVRALVGYSRVESSYLKQKSSLQNSGSVLVGGGLDFPLSTGWSSGAWYGRVGADLEDDWTATTRMGRVSVGVSYRFNARRSQR